MAVARQGLLTKRVCTLTVHTPFLWRLSVQMDRMDLCTIYSLCRPSVHPARISMFWLVGCSSAAYLCHVCACWFLQGMISRRKGDVSMNVFPVAGVDVSKHFSDMCILTPSNEVFDRMKIYHDTTSMDRALSLLQIGRASCRERV